MGDGDCGVGDGSFRIAGGWTEDYLVFVAAAHLGNSVTLDVLKTVPF